MITHWFEWYWLWIHDLMVCGPAVPYNTANNLQFLYKHIYVLIDAWSRGSRLVLRLSEEWLVFLPATLCSVVKHVCSVLQGSLLNTQSFTVCFLGAPSQVNSYKDTAEWHVLKGTKDKFYWLYAVMVSCYTHCQLFSTLYISESPAKMLVFRNAWLELSILSVTSQGAGLQKWMF